MSGRSSEEQSCSLRSSKNVFFSISVTDIVDSIEAKEEVDGWITVKLTNNMRNSRRIVELGSQLTGSVANPYLTSLKLEFKPNTPLRI